VLHVEPTAAAAAAVDASGDFEIIESHHAEPTPISTPGADVISGQQ